MTNLATAGEGIVPAVKETIIRTACPYHCSANFCGILAHVENGKVVKTEAADFPEHRFRRICQKGLLGKELLYHPDRLKYPLKRVGERGEGKWQAISWEEALDEVALKLRETADKYGARSVGWVLGGGPGATKFGAYTRFASLFQGTRVSTWGYGDGAAPCAGLSIFGNHDLRPFLAGHADAKLNILWGTNPAESLPFQMRHLLEAKIKGTRLVVIDPIFTASAAKADEYIGIRPGTDAALALGMMNVVLHEGLQDENFIRTRTVGPFLVRTDTGLFLRDKDIVEGDSKKYLIWDIKTNQIQPSDAPGVTGALHGSFEVKGIKCVPAFQLLEQLIERYSVEEVSKITGVAKDTIRKLAIAYGTSKPASIHVHHGLGRTYHGDLSFRAVGSLAAITGNIVPGTGLHRGLVLNWDKFLHPNKEAPSYSRLGVLSMYDAILKGKPYPIKAVWFAFINFINQCVNSNKIINELIPRLDFIVVADMFMTETAKYADIVLPVCTYLEHTDLIPGHFAFLPYVQLQQKVIDPLYQSRPDLDILRDLSKRMGFAGYFDKTEEEFIDLLLDSGHPSTEGITLEKLKNGPIRIKLNRSANRPEKEFNTPSGRIEFYAEKLREFGEELPVYKEPLESERKSLAKKYPLVFVQAHSKFRVHSLFTNISLLNEIESAPTLEINPVDAQQRGLKDGEMVTVFNDRGKVKVRARLNEGVRPGVVTIREGWPSRDFGEGSINSLTHDAVNPVQDVLYEPNMAMNDVLVDVKKG